MSGPRCRPSLSVCRLCGKFFLIVCLAGPLPTAFGQTEAELEQLRQTISRLQTELNQYRGEFAEAEQGVQQQEMRMAENHREIINAERSLDASAALISQLEQRAGELRSALEGQQQRLQHELLLAYRGGANEPLKLLLNQEGGSDTGRMLYYYRALLGSRTRTIQSYEETLASIGRNRESQQQEREYRSGLLASLNQSRNALRQSQAERETLLNQLEQSIAETEQQLAARIADRERLRTLLDSISEQMQELELELETNRTAFSDIRGQCSLPADGNLAARFGTTRTGSLNWDGVLIESQMGTSVNAVHNGRVVFADYLRGYGLLVILDHGEQYLTLYGHNQSLFVESGDWVLPGQQIAQVGISGGLREPALYFEIRQQGEAINPLNWCS